MSRNTKLDETYYDSQGAEADEGQYFSYEDRHRCYKLQPNFASEKEEEQFLKEMDTIDKDVGVEDKKYARLEETNSSLTGEAWEVAIIAFWKPKTGKKAQTLLKEEIHRNLKSFCQVSRSF